MKKGLAALGLAALLSLATSVAQAQLIIDDFQTTSGFSITDLSADGTAGIQGTGVSLTTTIDATNTVLGVLGGPTGWTRTIYAELDFVDAVSTLVCPTCNAGHLASGAGGASGNASWIYTGSAVDLSAYTGTTLDFLWAADQAGASLMVTFTDGTNTDTYTFGNTPSTGSSNPANFVSAGGVLLTFGSINEAQVTGVRVDILGVADLDATIDQGIPIPGTLGLLGLGLAGFVWRTARQHKA